MAETLKLYDFSGGLNTSTNNYSIKENETPECLNVTYAEQNVIVKRNGYSSVLESSLGEDEIIGLYNYYEVDGTKHLLATQKNSLYEINTTTGATTELEDGLTNTDTSFATLDGSVWISNGSDDLLFYDGSDITTNPNAPLGKYIVANNNHIYISGSSTNPSRIYYTELDDNGLHEWWNTSDVENETFTSNYGTWVSLANSPIQYKSDNIDSYDRGTDYEMDWENGKIKVLSTGSMSDSTSYDIGYSYKDGVSHYIDVRTNDGDKITGITRQSGNIVIFKTNSIHVLYGDNSSNYQMQEVIPNRGCIAPKSIVNINNYVYFLSIDGIYTFNGSQVKLMSHKIDDIVKEINNMEDACGCWYNHQYFLSYAESSSNYNNKVLVYNYLYEAWTMFDGINANIWNNYDGSQDGMVNTNKIYFGDSSKGEIYQYNVGNNDDGDDIELLYATKHFNFGSPEIIKTFRRILIDSVSEGDIYLDYDIDKGNRTGTYTISGYETDSTYKWGECTWDDLTWHTSEAQLYGTSMSDDAYGRFMRLGIREKSSNPLTIYGVVCEFRPRRRRY